MYRAVLDTCALVPGRQRDFLLQLAAEEAYTPLWSCGILFELDYVLAQLDAKRGRDDSDERRRHLFAQMERAFPGAEINAPKDREYVYGLNDPDDGHVAHAAILGKADAIVTDDSSRLQDLGRPERGRDRHRPSARVRREHGCRSSRSGGPSSCCDVAPYDDACADSAANSGRASRPLRHGRGRPDPEPAT